MEATRPLEEAHGGQPATPATPDGRNEAITARRKRASRAQNRKLWRTKNNEPAIAGAVWRRPDQEEETSQSYPWAVSASVPVEPRGAAPGRRGLPFYPGGKRRWRRTSEPLRPRGVSAAEPRTTRSRPRLTCNTRQHKALTPWPVTAFGSRDQTTCISVG